MGFIVRGDRVVTRGQDLSKLIINGKRRRLQNGKKHELSQGGFLLLQGNRLTVSSHNDEEADIYSFVGTTDKRGQKYYYNSYVRSAEARIGGICAGERKQGKGIFNHYKRTHKVHHKKIHCPKRRNYRRHCLKQKLKKEKL